MKNYLAPVLPRGSESGAAERCHLMATRELPVLAEAVSKRKITNAGGKYDLHFDCHVAKVELADLGASDSLPMWCAVPVTSKSTLF
jgi:hypothetical protein